MEEEFISIEGEEETFDGGTSDTRGFDLGNVPTASLAKGLLAVCTTLLLLATSERLSCFELISHMYFSTIRFTFNSSSSSSLHQQRNK